MKPNFKETRQTLLTIVSLYSNDPKEQVNLLRSAELSIRQPERAAPTEQPAPLFAHAPSEKSPYIQKLIDTGRINSEMTVLTSLADVAIFIRDSGINLKTNHLKQFKNPKTNKEYSSSSIRQAITAANTQ